jgi:hypothetical protein
MCLRTASIAAVTFPDPSACRISSCSMTAS